jgi:uncharacterized protein
MKKWAIITGASSGIGKALAFEFAKNGFNLLLTARNIEALQKVAETCESTYTVETEIYAADLASAESTDELAKFIVNKKIDVLVNNAGFGVKGDFAETEIADELKMLDVQLAAMLKLTKVVLPQMIANKRGNILNVASVYSFSPVPKQSVYSACKSFMLSFSSALRSEIENSGVSISVLCPGITQTEFRVRAGIADKKNSGMTAEKVAEITHAEMMRGKFIIIPGFQNKVFAFLSKHLPESARAWLIKSINNKRGVNQKN